MLKKRSISLLRPLNTAFEKQVLSLAEEGKQLTESYTELSARMLQFAIRFRELWDEAHRLDKRGNGRHQLYLRKQLASAANSDNPSVWSKWNTIGSQAKTLLRYKSAIPPQRECLYELAIAANEHKPIAQWVERKVLTNESTVREVSSLRKTKKRRARQKGYLATVTLAFDTYGDAAEALRSLLSSKLDFKVSSHRSFNEALKSEMDRQQYEKIETRFTL